MSAPFPLTQRWLWEEEEGDADTDAVFRHGSIVLGTDGWGMNWRLIVAGEHRGHIWFICGEGAAPFGGQFGGTTAQPGFACWVRHWAEGMPGGMPMSPDGGPVQGLR